MLKSPKKCRRVLITENNYSSSSIEYIQKYLVEEYPVVYYVVGFEFGENCSTPHYHLYIEFSRQVAFSRLKKTFNRAHIDFPKGTQRENIEYVKKSDTKLTPDDWMEYGKPKRSNVESLDANEIIMEYVKKGLSVKDLQMEENFKPSWIKSYELLRKYNPPEHSTRDKPCCIWLFGPGGSGKTTAAYDIFAERGGRIYVADLFMKGWLEGYDNEPNILIDDFPQDKDEISLSTFRSLLRLTDIWPCSMNSKGSVVHPRPSCVIVISQSPPWKIWGYVNEYQVRENPNNKDLYTHVDLRQVMRRFDKIIEKKVEIDQVKMPIIELVT